MTHQPDRSPLSTREKLAYGLAFCALAVFVVIGALLIANPSDALSEIYAVALLITLGIGVLSGIVVASVR